MKINIGDFQDVSFEDRVTKEIVPMLRFGVTVYDDKNEPLFTMGGWTCKADRTVKPASMTYRGKPFTYHRVSEKFKQAIVGRINETDAACKVLGPHRRQISKERKMLNIKESVLVEDAVGRS